MARLVDEFETIKRIKRALSSGIVYKTKENSPGSFFVVKCIPTKENIAGIKARHSDAVILNNEPEDKWVGIIGRTEQK